MERAIIYLIKNDTILENLIKEMELKEYCITSEYEIVDIIEVERPDINAILSHVEKNDINYVVLYEFKEITGNLAELKQLINLLDDLGASAVFLKERINTGSIIGEIITRLIDSLLLYKQ